MKRVESIGNMPAFLKVFLTKKLPREARETEVYDCTYQEIINRAQDEKLEPQVLIDKANTGKGFLCAVGASLQGNAVDGVKVNPPVFYFAELDESRKRMFMGDLAAAREKANADHKAKLAQDAIVKENTRKAGESLLG